MNWLKGTLDRVSRDVELRKSDVAGRLSWADVRITTFNYRCSLN